MSVELVRKLSARHGREGVPGNRVLGAARQVDTRRREWNKRLSPRARQPMMHPLDAGPELWSTAPRSGVARVG